MYELVVISKRHNGTLKKMTDQMIPKPFEPDSELTEFVHCYWTLESEKENTPIKNTIIPDGTMKLIFHYGDTYKHHPKNAESIIL